MERLRWGVLGASSRIYNGKLKPAMLAAGHKIVAEARRDNASEAPYAELLARRDVDAIYIPLPNFQHQPWILRALQAGKHVMCEKPLTLSVADTVEVFAAAKAADRVLMEAYMWPHHPRTGSVLELVASGALGALESVRTTFTFPYNDPTNHRLDERGAGALFDLGIYCLGPAMLMVERDHVGVCATATRNAVGVDEAMHGYVDWGQGVGNSFTLSFHAASGRTLEVVGSKAVLMVDDFVPGPMKSSKISITGLDGRTETIKVGGANAFSEMSDQFCAAVRGEAPLYFDETRSVRLAKTIADLHANT